jgi:4-hydroxy-3-methylbut-2-en-1-yl diphosphate reductase
MTVRRVLLVSPRGFCAGVVRAIDTVERALEHYGPPVYVRRAIVHNHYVVADLARRGAVFVDELAEVPPDAVVVLSAHGVSRRVEQQAVELGLRAIDATCPLVAKVHREVERFVAEGYQVVLIGHAGHDEVAGTLGRADGVRLVSTVADVERLEVRDRDRVACVTQTTLVPGEVDRVVAALRARFPRLVLPPSEDVCYATRNRQGAARWLAERSDVVLVLGDRTSSNAQRLREVASARRPAFLLDSIAALDPGWLSGAETIGITAAASTPDLLVQAAAAYFVERGATLVDELLEVEPAFFPTPALLP